MQKTSIWNSVVCLSWLPLVAIMLSFCLDGRAEEDFVRDGQLDLEAVVKHFEDLYRSNSSIAEAELIVTRPRRARSMKMKIWTEGEEKSLIVIEAPVRDKGTATLKVDKNLWNYMPRIKRTIRIPPSMMLASWMGSDFTNDDLVRESSFSRDYTYEVMEQAPDAKGWRVRFTAKPDVVGLWNRFELLLSEDGDVPIEAQFFDRKDRLARTLYWTEVKVWEERKIPTHLTLVPEGEEGNKTEMIYHSLHFDVNLPKDTFSLSRLEQKR